MVIYDVEKCEVVSRRTRPTTQAAPNALAAPGAPDQGAVAHLSWVEGEGPDTPRSTYQHQFVYRHMRLFSKPPHAGKGEGGEGVSVLKRMSGVGKGGGGLWLWGRGGAGAGRTTGVGVETAEGMRNLFIMGWGQNHAMPIGWGGFQVW